MKTRSPGMMFYPEKFLAGTRHLSEKDRSIYMDMMCRIWILSPSQVDFPDTTPMWMTLTGIDDAERVERIRKRFMAPGLELFAKKVKKKANFLVQKGMRKEKVKQVRNSKQNSANARKGWETRRSGDAAAKQTESGGKKSAMHSLSFSSSYSNKKTRNAFHTKSSKKEKEQIGKTLSVYLERYQIENVFRYMPDVPADYVDEKIRLAVQKKPENMAAFLYSAIMQNYHPGGNGGESLSGWLKKALKQNLSKEEFLKVPESDQGRFEAILVPGAEKKEFKLISKPKETKNYVEKRLFKSMKIGECVDKNAFSKLRPDLQEHFEEVSQKEKEQQFYRLIEK